MLICGLENAKAIKANFFLPYAGYSKAYVKGFNYEKETCWLMKINYLCS